METKTPVLAAILILLVSGSAAAQAPTARHVAAQVQSFYDQTSSVEARFVQTYYNRVYGRYERSRGAIQIAKPGRMRFDYDRPNGKIIASDGSDVTMWEPGDEGGAGQYMKTSMRDSALSGALSFLLGEGRLERDYRFRLLAASTHSFSGHVLELRPIRPDPRFRRVLLYVDSAPSRAGLVHAIRIDDHDGNRNKLELSAMRFGRDIPRARFAFAPPRGARRVEL